MLYNGFTTGDTWRHIVGFDWDNMGKLIIDGIHLPINKQYWAPSPYLSMYTIREMREIKPTLLANIKERT